MVIIAHRFWRPNCFEELLIDNVIPIVNENDVLATTDLMFTDNDELAGLVAEQLKADCLIILTGTDGILDNDARTVQEVNASNFDAVSGYINSDKTTSGRVGMVSRFNVAKTLTQKGTIVFIVNGRKANALLDVTEGKSVGTCFTPRKGTILLSNTR